jgi:excisionase family DNA binding protein
VKPEVFTIPQAARLCGVSRWTIRNLVTSGKLKASRTHGGHYRILGQDLESFILEKKMFSLARSTQKKILIADDDPQIRTLLGRILSPKGYALEYASDGFETGVKVIKFKPHLIILDLIMPKMDGFEVCRRLKEDPDTASIKIIAISGYDTERNRQRILDCGADLFLGKGLIMSNLLKDIGRVLV